VIRTTATATRSTQFADEWAAAAMKDCQDAFGHAMWDHWEGRPAVEVAERDDGYLDVTGGPAAYFTEAPKWPSRYRRAMRFVRGRVLDVGCGAGRHALYLQHRGHIVVGVDISPLAVQVCRARRLRDARVLPIGGVGPSLGVFDTVLMLGNNFGLFGGFERARTLLRRLASVARPGTRIIAESTDPYDTSNPAHLAYHVRNRARGRMSGQIRLRVRYKHHATPWFDYLLVSKKEMEHIVDGSDWVVHQYVESGGPQYIGVIEYRPGGSGRRRRAMPSPKKGGTDASLT
jgi:SAM-dependent methyltransferase